MKAHLIYPSYYCKSKGQVIIGGIETYISNLCRVLQEIADDIIVYQCFDEESYDLNYGSINIINDNKRNIHKRLKRNFDSEDLCIFLSELFAFPVDNKNSIQIQHGVYWDIPLKIAYKNNHKIIQKAKCLKNHYLIKRRLKYASHLVATDYNFFNWAQQNRISVDEVILNYSTFECINSIPRVNNTKPITILFPRRFEMIRGTRIIYDIIQSKIFDNFQFILAGWGSDRDMFSSINKNNVMLKEASHTEMEVFYQQSEIVLIPTIASEGTSFSCLEAMAKGCVVIATPVGGLSNIIIDNFNGFFSKPTSANFIQRLEYVVNNLSALESLRLRAVETIKASFTYHRWREDWIRFLKTIID